MLNVLVQCALCVATSLTCKQTLEETSFVAYVIRMVLHLHNETTAVRGKSSACLRWCFDILTNVTNVPEGRSLLFKVIH